MNWESRTLGEICTKIISGGTPLTSNKEHYHNGTIPWLKTKEINQNRIYNAENHITDYGLVNSSAKLIPKNSVIIAMYGDGKTAGRVAINKIPVTTNQACCNLIINSDLAHYEFVFYNLMSRYEELVLKKTGSGQQNLNLKIIKDIEINLPPLSQQKAIANILSGLDEKINLNNQTNQTLESIAQVIFKNWFIDFEPVRAKIVAKQEGKDPELAAMCVISGKSEAELVQMTKEDFAELQATAALFPDALVESELGEVPKGWRVNSLGSICNFTPGSAFKPEYQGQIQGDIPFIKVSDMNLNGNEVFIIKANNYLDDELQKKLKFKIHEKGATVFAKIGVALISNRRRILTRSTLIDNNMMSASPLEGLSTSYYLYLLLKTIDFNTLVSGTALPYLNVSDLRKISIVHPTKNLLNKFESTVNAIFQKINLNSVQNEGLEVLRDNLLPRLLTGDLVIEGSGE